MFQKVKDMETGEEWKSQASTDVARKQLAEGASESEVARKRAAQGASETEPPKVLKYS